MSRSRVVLCGSVAVGRLIWVGRCGFIMVDWLLWVGRCGSIAVSRLRIDRHGSLAGVQWLCVQEDARARRKVRE